MKKVLSILVVFVMAYGLSFGGETYLCVLSRLDANADFPVSDKAVMIGQQAQMIILNGERKDVWDHVDSLANSKLTALVVITANRINFPEFIKDTELILAKTKRNTGELDNGRDKDVFLWLNEGAPELLYLTNSKKVVAEGDIVLVTGNLVRK